MDECAEVGEDFQPIYRTILYNQYKEWAKDNGVGQLKSPDFYERLASIEGITAKKINGKRCFSGIRLNTQDLHNGIDRNW